MLSGERLIAEACQELGFSLADLVAKCAIWAHPEVVARLQEHDRNAAWFPMTRRMRITLGERRGQFVDGVRLDDNTYANQAIKIAAIGSREIEGFHTSHVWPGSCYDPRYHTCIANLVLIPAPLAGLE